MRCIRWVKFSGVENVEGLKFNVGVDPDNNHADPVSMARWTPLGAPGAQHALGLGERVTASLRLEGGAGLNGLWATKFTLWVTTITPLERWRCWPPSRMAF